MSAGDFQTATVTDRRYNLIFRNHNNEVAFRE